MLPKFQLKKSTFVYIDGLNLYYRIKKTPFRWLNLDKFVKACLDQNKHDIQKIKFFTARTKKSVDGPGQNTRQDLYLQAVQTLPNLEIVWGQFKKRQVRGFLCNSQGHETTKKVLVSKFEEKKSDVNIATHMIEDGYQEKYECMVLISNDTDLTTPLISIKRNLKKRVVVVSPYETVHADLRKSSHYAKRIKTNDIFEKSQFPLKMKTPKGEIHCPKSWLLHD